jgi:integrase/recombinase XerD
MSTAELQERLDRYLALRRALGFAMLAEERLLRDFLRFCQSQTPDTVIRAQTALEWACSTAAHCGPGGQARRLSVARGFLRHLQASVPQTEIPSAHLIGGAVRRTPYLYSEAQIKALMEHAQNLKSCGGLRPHTIATLIGLLVSCGLRASEALRLRLTDVDLGSTTPHLRVLQTKFRKSRLVPMDPSTTAALQDYAKQRHRLGYDNLIDRFFVSERGTPQSYAASADSFRILVRCARIREGTARPTLHCLRHTFAVRRLIAWYHAGEDVQARIPELSVYLGHVRPQETYWYLSATPRLLDLAALRFEALVGPEHAS